jgi:hypothetical protein
VLPCFARATLIEQRISHLRFKLPPTDSFTSLEQLTLFGASLIDLGVLLPHCPRMRSLMMDCNYPGRGIKALTVEFSSLDQLIWHLLNIKQSVNFVLSSFSRKFTIGTQAGGVVLRVLS